MNTERAPSEPSIVERLVADESLDEFRQAYRRAEEFQRSSLHEGMRHRVAEAINKTSSTLSDAAKGEPSNGSV